MSSQTASIAWKGPVAAWALMGLLLGGLLYVALYLHGAQRFWFALAGSASLIATLGFVLVGVARLDPLKRLVASVGWLFLALMLMMSFADLLTRAE